MTDTKTRGLWDWLWQREHIRRSREQLATKSTKRLELERQSMVLAEAGDRVLRPVSPLRSGSGESAAALLYKQSITLTLMALGSSVDRLAGDDALRKCVSDALPDSISFELLCQLLTASSEARSDQADLSITSLQATALADVAHALLELARAPELGLQRAWVRRLKRVVVAAVLLAIFLGAAISMGERLAMGPDLAEGKPWQVSSAYKGFSSDAGRADGKKTKIFFHTNREQSPWVEFDLGAPTLVRRVDIQNRRDCCRDRAFPLVIEGSLDREKWQELGRQTEPFSQWTLDLQPTEVRYVRAKALKRTVLHLEGFEVR